jgi:hypothetical protein
MGYIPLFLTMGGACMLFFLTVRITMLRKLTLQRDLFSQLGKAHPELSIQSGELRDPDQIIASWKSAGQKSQISQSSLDIIRELKINRLQYNQLIKKAPYNWVAKISGFQPI